VKADAHVLGYELGFWEVSSMTELKIKTLSMQLAEQEEQLAEKDEQLAAYKTELADKEAIIAELKKQLTALR